MRNKISTPITASNALGTIIGTLFYDLAAIFIAGAIINAAAGILQAKFGLPIPDLTYWNWCIMYWAARILFRNVLWGKG